MKLYRARRPTREKPKRSVWQLRWLGTSGTRCCETIGVVGEMTKKEAEYVQRQKQGKLDCRVIRPDRPNRITLKEFIKWHEDTVKDSRGIRTIRQYRVAGAHAVIAIGGKTVVSKIDVTAARRVVAHLVKLKRSPATIRKTISKLRTMIGRAVRANFIAENPFLELELPRVQSRQKRIYSEDELNAMVDACPDQWWRSFISLAVGTGLRFQEVLHLTWRDIDLEQSQVEVAAKRADRFQVKGRGDFPIFEWSSKTHTGRVIPLPPDVVHDLSELRSMSDGSAYVFVDLDRLQALDAKQEAGQLREDFEIVNNVLRDFKVIQKLAFEVLDRDADDDAPPRPLGTIHDLRKTYGTRMANAVPMHVLKDIMGHADITTTAKYYLGAAEGHTDQIRAAACIKTDAQLTRKPKLRLVGQFYPYPQKQTTPALNGSC